MNKINELQRMKDLISYGKIEESSNKDKNTPRVEYQVKAADGKTYGIVNECHKFYIKVAPKKDTKILSEDFDYIGGFMNKKENEFNSYNMASKQLELKINSINENFDKENRVIIEKPQESSEWQINETKEMRNEINRFNQILGNVNSILSEDKSGFTPVHELPEAPSKNPSDKKVNSPFTNTAVAKGNKDFNKKSTEHKKAAPYNLDGEISDTEMTSDKNPKGKSGSIYSEKPKYVETGVAGQKGKKTMSPKVNEGKKRTIKLTEEQVLAWSKNKDFMDKSNGTKIGNTSPYDENVNEESMSMDYGNCQNCPKPGMGKVGDTAPFDENVNESEIPFEDTVGDIDNDDIDLDDDDIDLDDDDIDLEDDDLDDDDIENNELRDSDKTSFNRKNRMINDDNTFNNDDENDFDNDYTEDNDIYSDNDISNLDLNNYDDDYYDYDNDFSNPFDESINRRDIENPNNIGEFELIPDEEPIYKNENINRKRNKRSISEEIVLNDFGKHPAYRKTPFTTPENKDINLNGTKDWNDDSVKGNEPFGSKIGSTAPYTEKVVDMITDKIMRKLNF